MSKADFGHDAYFYGGASALKQIILAMLATGKQSFQSILDMPCGHGRVLRFLKARFPNASLAACDLDRDAVDFCADTFGAEAIYSHKDVRDVVIEKKFDLIWCGSLLTHLNQEAWPVFLDFFADHLEEGGLLIFTTHGRFSVKKLREQEIDHSLKLREQEIDYSLNSQRIPDLFRQYLSTGFGYLDYEHSSDYGISICSPTWVVSLIEPHPHLKIVSLTEMGWDNHQDVIACTRSTNAW